MATRLWRHQQELFKNLFEMGRYATELATAGITPEDIAALETTVNALIAIDQEQEESKNARKTRKSELIAAQKTIREIMFKINKAAAIVFMHDRAKPAGFKSIFAKTKTKTEPV